MRIHHYIMSSNTVASVKTIQVHLLANVNYSFVFFFNILLLFTKAVPSQCDWLLDCGDCYCKWNSGKKTADCRNLSLIAVPENLSSELQVLDLSNNHISYLERNVFIAAQLQNLHKLFIRNSSVKDIEAFSFAALDILIELDLSHNLLRSLRSNLFSSTPKIRALILNSNLLESLEDGVFVNLRYLYKIELKYNRIWHIETQAFTNVPLLTQIYLDGNKLGCLRKESFESHKRLTALSLDQNPWNCSCELQLFRAFVLKRNLYTPPTACYYPAHLRGMLWAEQQLEPFACRPHIVYPSAGASITTSKENVTLVCRVHTSPKTLIAWKYNKKMFRSSMGPSEQRGRISTQLMREEQPKERDSGRNVFISRLSIRGAEKSDEGSYTCLAENAAGKDAVQMSLLVHSPEQSLVLRRDVIVVIGLTSLGLISVSGVLAMITCCIYKHCKAGSSLNMDAPGAVAANSSASIAGGLNVVLGVTANNVSEKSQQCRNFQKQQTDNMEMDDKKNHRNYHVEHSENSSYFALENKDSIRIKYPHVHSTSDIGSILPNGNQANLQSTSISGAPYPFQPDLLPTYRTNQSKIDAQYHINSLKRTINPQKPDEQEGESLPSNRQSHRIPHQKLHKMNMNNDNYRRQNIS